MHPVHVILAAWDWKFSSSEQNWVLVTLKGDTKFAGFCGVNSFISSDPNERDIFIGKVYDFDDDKWIDNDRIAKNVKSVLITAGEIKTIGFWLKKQGEYENVKGK